MDKHAGTVADPRPGFRDAGRAAVKVLVHPMEIGGGFGGKFTAYTDVPAAMLSRSRTPAGQDRPSRAPKCCRPPARHPVRTFRVKMGATKDGKITAAEAELIYEAGAYPGSPVGAGAGVILAPYKIDNIQIDGYDVVVNRPKTGAYRAPGGTNAAFASESVIDELAETTGHRSAGVPPAQCGGRRRSPRADGPIFARIGYVQTIEAAIAHPHYKSPLEGPNRGRGVASGFWFNGGGKSSVSASVNPTAVSIFLRVRPISAASRRRHRHAIGGDPRNRRRRCEPPRGGHGLRRLQRRHRRQPCDLRDRLRSL